ncbi:MAG TPA: 3-deoxy-manno-octulosonate cytidylyltransferase [Rhizomicrobium sp.]|nr:3-deoxy-manno-octulosonate cytidylyltransferase [Rhizomicrobium sp.]
MNPILLIPARMASTRLPDKPLATIGGVPMIVRVWARAVAAGLGPVVVAAGESAIVAAVEKAGGKAVLTDPTLPSGSDRIWAALQAADPGGRHDVVVNLQGDLPALDPEQLKTVVAALARSGADIATLAAPIDNQADAVNPAVVKAVVAWDAQERLGRALYFTRATAPTGEGTLYHHVGLYAYRRQALENFVALPPSPLEEREKLEQLRALEAGMSIAVARVDEAPLSVDTPADLEKARKLLS